MRQGGPRERSRSAKERRAKGTREWRRTRWVARRLGRDKKAGVGSRRYSGGGREGRVGARETATGCNFVQRERGRATRRRRSETESFVGTYGKGWKKNERGDATRGRVGECSARESHLTGGREKGYIRRVPLLRGGLDIGAAHRTHEEGNSHAVHLLPLAPLHPIPPLLRALFLSTPVFSFSSSLSSFDGFYDSILRQPFRYFFVSLSCDL